MDDWHTFREIDRARLREARLQTHYAAQWLGRIGAAFVAPQLDYSHTSMSWDRAISGFTTHLLIEDVRIGLKIADLALFVLGNGAKPEDSFSLNERSDVDVRKWLDARLGARGLKTDALDKTSSYAIAAHAVGGGAAYDTSRLADALSELAKWFDNAYYSLGEIRRQMAERSLNVSPVRCWPHHFDMATLISIDETSGEGARSINAGFSPGDEHYEYPYFYVSPYPYPDPKSLPLLLKLGHWHTRDFVAAIAPANRIVEMRDQEEAIHNFLNEATQIAMKVLNAHPIF